MPPRQPPLVAVVFTKEEADTIIELIEDTWRGSDTWGHPLEQRVYDLMCHAAGRKVRDRIELRREAESNRRDGG